MIELGKEVERLRSETGPALPTTSPEALRLEELHQELEDLRQTNKSLIEQNEELQAMMLTRGVEEGRNLLNGTSNSLAQELGELNERQVMIESSINLKFFCSTEKHSIIANAFKTNTIMHSKHIVIDVCWRKKTDMNIAASM